MLLSPKSCVWSFFHCSVEKAMGVPSILALFLISHQLLLHSAGENNVCPDSYDCGNHGQVGFPYSNNKYRHCGFFTVNCSGSVAELNLGVEGLWYEVGGKFLNDSVYVNDLRLGDLIDKNSCDVFGNYLNWTLIDNPSISFIMPPSLTLFKCTTISPKLDKQQDDYFHGNDSYRDCAGYTVYYTFPPNYNLVSTVGDFPPNCSVIQLPVVSEIENRNASDLFSVLSSEFSIRFHVRKACRECRQKGGRCAHNTPEFHCIKMEEAGRRKLSLLLGTAAAGIGIFVIILFCIIKKLALSKSVAFWRHKTESDRKIEAFLKSCGSLSPERYTYSDVKKMTNSFRIKLGQGGYGCVFKGKLENGCFVAVKVLKGLKGNGEEFINEVATISRTSHVNIVTLIGFCFDGCHRALIYEFMPNGSLDKFIHDGDSSTYWHLGWEALYRIAVGIARGLEYLHRGCNTRILHFDIKPHNILLNEDFCPKISDFGLAKLCPQKESIISLMVARGTVGYIAPEVFNRNFGGVSHKSDVYSYGMMILEMVGGRKNVSVEVDHTSEIYFPHWVYKRLELDEELGLHSIMNDETNDNVKKMIIVGLWCIQTYPCNRPSMSRVLDMLEGSTESLEIPPKPFLTSPSRPPVDSSTTLVL